MLGLVNITSTSSARELDNGGLVSAYITNLAITGAFHDPISGDCKSACTIRLANRGACVYPDTVLWFHAATGGEGTGGMLALYPPRVRALVSKALTKRDFTLISGVDLHRHAGVPLCRH